MKSTDPKNTPKRATKPLAPVEPEWMSNLTRIQRFALQTAWTDEAQASPEAGYDTANDYRCALQIQWLRDEGKGHAVWLASVSMQPRMARKRMRTVDQWTESEIEEATDYLLGLTMNRGDQARQFLFQTQINLCLAVALTDQELAAIPRPPTDGRRLPRFVAGAYTREREIRGFNPAAVLPCAAPERTYPFTQGVPDEYLFVLAECGACETCKARMNVVVELIDKKLPAHEQPQNTGDPNAIVPRPLEKGGTGEASGAGEGEDDDGGDD